MNLDAYHNLWGPLQPVLFGMERHGFCVDLQHLGAAACLARADLLQASAALQSLVPELNPRSSDQIKEWLKREGVPPSPVTKKGPAFGDQESTDQAALEYLADHYPQVKDALRLILRIRKIHSGIKYCEKLRDHALQGPDGAWRVHCSITRAAATGRLAAARPELHQIPKDVRKDLYGVRRGFVASPGHRLVVVDQSQLEMRILADYLSRLFQDSSLVADLAAQDCHSANALRVFGPLRGYLRGVLADQVKTHPDARVRQCRDDIKAVIYGMNYGKGDWGLGGTLRDEHGEPVGRKVARKVMDGVFGLYPSLRRYHGWVGAELRKTGGIHTLLGRFRPLAGAKSGSKRAWRQGVNTPMQGGGADIMDLVVLAMSRDKDLDRLGYRMIVPVHDEVVGEAPEAHAEEAGAIVKHHFESAYRLAAPLMGQVGIAENWADGH